MIASGITTVQHLQGTLPGDMAAVEAGVSEGDPRLRRHRHAPLPLLDAARSEPARVPRRPAIYCQPAGRATPVGRFTRVDRDAALRELHESLRHALAEAGTERRQLSKALLPRVPRFYADCFDPEADRPYYRPVRRP